MTNINCLEGFKCPKCGADDVFYIEARVVLKLTDEGTSDADYPHEWDNKDRCSCLNDTCEYTGLIGEFRGIKNDPRDELFRKSAKLSHHKEGEIEIDEKAEVSHGDDNGAYVQAWVWVPASNIGEGL